MDEEVLGMLKAMHADLQSVKEDVRSVKEEVQAVKEDVKSVKEDVQSLKEEVKVVKEDVRLVKDEMQTVREQLDRIEHSQNEDIVTVLQLMNTKLDRMATKEDFQYVAAKLGEHDLEIDRLKRAK